MKSNLIHGHEDNLPRKGVKRYTWRETWGGDTVGAGEIMLGLIAVFLFICVGLAMSVGLACVVGGLISWLTGFPFVPTTIFVWVIMVIFGRNR